MNEVIRFQTKDGVTVIGDYYEGGSDRAALLLHMMPATRSSWVALANTLVETGISVLTIDLRGHGDSISGPNGTILDYKKFSDEEHRATIQDVAGGVEFLKSKKAKVITLVGASIGANLALEYGSRHHEIKLMVLLSPGINYRGVDGKSAISKMAKTQKAYFLASKEDEYSAASTQELYNDFPGGKVIELFSDAGHGTTMLERKPEFLKILADWIHQ